jgi:hypothetical protein
MADKEPNREAADRLFKAVTSQNVNVGDFDTFYSKLSEPDGTARLIAALDKNNIYIGGVDEVNGKLFGGTNPAEKKNGTEKPVTVSPADGGSSGLQKIDYKGQQYEYNPKTGEAYKGGQPVDSATQAYIDKNILGKVTTAPQDGEQPKPYTLGQVATERKKKVELNKGLKGAAQSYKDYEDANKNLRNAQMDLTAGLQGEKDVIQTDVLGKPVAIQGSLSQEKVKGLTENVNIAKANKQAAKESLIKVAPAFKDRNIDIVSELQKDNTDVEETVIPQAVEKIKFVEDISDLEDNLKQNGQTLDDWSKYVDTEAPKEFLDDKQRALYDVVKTGDEAKIKAAQEAYYKDIDDEIRGIDSQITQISVSGMPIAGTGVGGQQQIADLKKQKEDLLNKKQGFLQPADALKQVAEIDPSFGVFDQLFAKISPMQRVKMTLDNLYAKRVKQKAELNAMTNDPQIVLTQALPFQNKISDLNADIIKTDQAIKLLAPIAFLNQKPDMEQSNWTRFGRGVWNTMLEENSGISFPKKEDIADKTTSLMAASQTLDNISIAGKKALKATVPTLTDKAIDMASYMTAIGVTYAPIGGIVKATRLPAMARMAFSNIGKYSPLLGRIAPSLATMTTEGVTSELTGRALGGNAKQDLTFLSKFGSQGVTELLNNSPFGKLVSKAISGIGIKEVPKFVQTLAKINSTGTGSLIEEGVEEGISMYQNSDSYEDFKKQIKQFVGSPSDLFLFAASSYALGGFTSGISPNVSNKFYQAADKAYSDLPPDEKTAFDNVVNDVKQGQEDAVMEVVLKTVDKVPNKVVDGLVIELKQGVDKLVNTVVGEDGYEVKIGDTVYQGNTIQDLQNDIDDAQGLLAIYKGEQDNRIQNGITIEETETPPTAQGDQADVVLAKPEAGLGVEPTAEQQLKDVQDGNTVTFEYANESEVPEVFKDKISSSGENNGKPFVRVTVAKSLADFQLNKATTPSPINAANAPETGQNAQDNGQQNTNVTFKGKRGQADSISFDGKTIKQGEEIELNDVNISQDDSMPDLRSGKYKVRMLSVDANGKTATLTLTDGNEVITTTVKDLRKAQTAPTTTTQTTTENLPQGGVTEPTKAPAIKAQVVGTTAGFNTIIDGGLGKQKDPRTAFTSSERSPVFETQPNNNESSLLDISLPSTDAYGRQGGIQIRFELPNGVDANTVFKEVVVGAALAGRLDAKDPDFYSKVQGLVDRGIAKIQGLTTGGAGQTAQVKETVSEKQVTPTTTSENPALKNVQSTATALSKIDKSVIDATLPLQPLEIDGYKREYRNDSPVSIAEAYHKAKADKSNPDLVNAVEELLAPKETAPTQKVDEGQAKPISQSPQDAEIASVFNSNPELAKIGTQQQYSQYLDSIFPNSKVKDIVFHGSASEFDAFEKEKLGINTKSPSAYNGFFFAKDKDTSLSYIGEQVFEYSQEYIDYVNQFRNELDRLENEINKTFADRETILKKLDNLITKLLDFINGRKLSAKEKELAVKLENLYDEFKKTREKNLNLQKDVSFFVKKFNKDVNDVVKTYIKQNDNTYLYRTILNIEKPNYHNDKNQGYRVETYNNRTLEDKKKGYDGTIIQNTKDLGSYVVSGNYYLKNPVKTDTDVIVVYEPDQIHILGTKKDIDGFKEFVDKNNIGTDKDTAKKTEATDKDVDKVAEATGTKAKNIRDLYDINRKLFGQDRVKSLAAAVAMDRMIGAMAKRAGTTKAEMYARLEFKKDTEANVLKADNALFQGTINGENVTLRNTDIDVVNGFYSPLRKIIAEAKQDKMPAKQWAEKFAKGDEAKWTGLTDWLAQQQGSVSKADILAYLKDNRISVVEVVKEDGSNANDFTEQEQVDDIYNSTREELARKNVLNEIDEDTNNPLEDFYNNPNQNTYNELVDFADGYGVTVEQIDFRREGNVPNVKFSQYQLEGDKSNYKEVLVTLPSTRKKVEPLTELPDEYEFITDGKKIGVIPKTQGYAKTLNGWYDTEQEALDNALLLINSNRQTKADREVKEFKSSHFNEPNILVHLRMNTRTDAEGNKVLFLEEVQSDWGQEGKKKGFGISDAERLKYSNRKTEIENKGKAATEGERAEWLDIVNNKLTTSITPTAPFVTDTNAWVKLGLKVALKEAVAQGATKIAWTTGEQQNDRYDLAKTVSVILYNDNGKGGYDVFVKGLNGEKLYANENASLKDVEATLGKDIADKMANNAGDVELGDVKSLKGDNLKVGGKGMKGFYGSPTEGSLGIVGNVAKSLFKQDVGTVEFKTKGKQEYTVGKTTEDVKIFSKRGDSFTYNGDPITKQRAFEIVERGGQFEAWSKSDTTQNSITVTPELRTQVQNGLALFQKQQGQNAKGAMVAADGNFVIYALTDPNVSTPLHEVAHVFEHYLTDGERATINNWAKTGAWTTETSEKFARGFEKYLSEGIAPTEGLKKVFEKFKTWLTDIYNGIKGSDIDIELNDDMRSIYAQMLGEDAVPPQKAKAKATPKQTTKAIQGDVVDNLLKGNTRSKALNNIADTNIKEVAAIVSDTNGRFEKVMDILNGDTNALTELEESLGFKKICS